MPRFAASVRDALHAKCSCIVPHGSTSSSNYLYLGPDDLTPDDKYAAFFPSLTQKDFDWGIVDKVNFRKEGLEFEKPVHDAALIFWGGPWEDRKGHPKHIMLF